MLRQKVSQLAASANICKNHEKDLKQQEANMYLSTDFPLDYPRAHYLVDNLRIFLCSSVLHQQQIFQPSANFPDTMQKYNFDNNGKYTLKLTHVQKTSVTISELSWVSLADGSNK